MEERRQEARKRIVRLLVIEGSIFVVMAIGLALGVGLTTHSTGWTIASVLMLIGVIWVASGIVIAFREGRDGFKKDRQIYAAVIRKIRRRNSN
jgi:ABC-type Co2+ transport system permease subunit